jgi:hypothetical protein
VIARNIVWQVKIARIGWHSLLESTLVSFNITKM